ncbi:hypothetical protein FGO68_gene12059 [Halteria grandinella]|uniref:Ion transport domain-containing protein n=1 Tax=Halteria grandinella TaxID=5974 RepID=A0A8J8T7U5_HALGN|nr:hypothetical protein FGO68_gene12059 [Halteria grandinella]
MSNLDQGIKIAQAFCRRMVLYPDDKLRAFWELAVALMLLVTCLITPFNVAFQGQLDDYNLQEIDQIINGFFIMDIVVNFFTAYYDDESELVESHKVNTLFLFEFYIRKQQYPTHKAGSCLMWSLSFHLT